MEPTTTSIDAVTANRLFDEFDAAHPGLVYHHGPAFDGTMNIYPSLNVNGQQTEPTSVLAP